MLLACASHRQNQVRQLEDTWPLDGLCIYKYQLATQVDRRQVHPSHIFGQILIASRACDYLNTRTSDKRYLDASVGRQRSQIQSKSFCADTKTVPYGLASCYIVGDINFCQA